MAALLGVGLVVFAALATAVQVLCVRVGTDGGRSADALVVVLLTNVCVLVPLGLVTGYPDYELTARAVVAFGSAGLVGTMLGRAFYYAGIARVGASRAEPIKGSMPLYATVVAVLVLGERLSSGRAIGIVLIVLGVAIVSRELATDSRGVDANPRELLFPLVGAFFYAMEPTFAKVGFAEGTPVLVALSIKTLTATLTFLGYLRLRGALPSSAGLRASKLRWYLGAGLANTAFLLAYYAALEIAPVTLVVPIMQTSPLFVLVLSLAFLPRLERVTPRLVAAASVLVAGAVLVTVYS